MKLLTYRTENGLRVGVKTEKGVMDASHLYSSMEELLAAGEQALSALKKVEVKTWLSEADLELGPCIPNPSKIICVGTNYRKHAEESKMPIPPVPLLFNKFGNTIAADGDDVLIPFNSEQVDYEAELGIVIGKTARRVSKADALDYVFGYCNVNDLSARDLQFRTHQWLLGKSCDGFSPVGPYLVTADEVGNPNQLGIKCIVNGEVRQDSNTEDMIFYCDEIVSYISEHMTLYPGDLILTGTPQGVVFNGFDGKVCHKKEHLDWLKDGDLVTIEIEKLGKLTNRMKQEV